MIHKRALALLLAGLTAFAACARAMPALDGDGFLASETGEYVRQDAERGRWAYFSHDLRVVITRHQTADPKLRWYETHIFRRGDAALFNVHSNPDKIGSKRIRPRTLARRYRLVLGFSDDFYTLRLSTGAKLGTIIRDGALWCEKNYRSQEKARVPNLDVLCLWADGSMRVFGAAEHTGEELLAMGVTQCWSFGPWLVREGALNPRLGEARFNHREPRQALGMIAPGHYLLLTVEGRSDLSKGATLTWMAERLQALGVTEALNLDGGNSTALIFMGEEINKASPPNRDDAKIIRHTSSLIGIGQSEQVPAEK